MFSGEGVAGSEGEGVGSDEEEVMESVEEMKRELERLRMEGVLDSDIDGAYWGLEQAQKGRGGMVGAVEYAGEVLARYGKARGVVVLVVEAKRISKEEHDAMAGEMMPSRTLTKEEYERMMREAQG